MFDPRMALTCCASSPAVLHVLAAARQRQIRRTEKHMAAFLQQANSQLDSAGRFELKAAIITFNEQQHAAACLAACPQRWAASWFQPRRFRFLGEYRFWVERAKPPEDYVFENLSVSRLSRYARMVRFVCIGEGGLCLCALGEAGRHGRMCTQSLPQKRQGQGAPPLGSLPHQPFRPAPRARPHPCCCFGTLPRRLPVARRLSWQALVRLAVLCILLASAGAVTKLMALNMQAARTIDWNSPALDSRIAISMQAYPLSTSQAGMAAQAANDTLARVAAAAGSAAAEQLSAGSAGYAPLAYCSVQLLQTCSQGLST